MHVRKIHRLFNKEKQPGGADGVNRRDNSRDSKVVRMFLKCLRNCSVGLNNLIIETREERKIKATKGGVATITEDRPTLHLCT